MRTLSAIFGTLLAILVVASIFIMSGVKSSYFLSPLGLIVVIGGTMSAIFLSYSLEDVLRVVSISARIFLRKHSDLKLTGMNLLRFSEQCRQKGIPPSISREQHPFLNDCLVLINDGYDSEEIREMLEKRIETFYENESYEVSIINSMAKHPPSFGMIGTVVGLIALMSQLGGGEAGLEKIGPYLAVALTTTLYGLMISSFIFRPIADNLEIKIQNNMKQRLMILEVALLIKNKASQMVIQDTINALLPPRHQIKLDAARGVKVAA
jgi:chemotaxis protein MotA